MQLAESDKFPEALEAAWGIIGVIQALTEMARLLEEGAAKV